MSKWRHDMDKPLTYPLFLIVLSIVCLSFLKAAAAAPTTPDRFYARVGTTVYLPCVADKRASENGWVAEHEASFRTRTKTYEDKNNPKLLIKEIKNVQESDAGLFTCSDGYEVSGLTLVIYEGSEPLKVSGNVTGLDSINVKWEVPDTFPEYVRGYIIYTREITGFEGERSFKIEGGREEFLLTDMSPGTTYEIEVVALYAEGASDEGGTFEGPKSQAVTIETPNIDAPPENVRAKSWKHATVLVTWLPPVDVDANYIHGYFVYYEAQTANKQPSGEVEVTGGQLNTLLRGLQVETRYSIQVAAFADVDRRMVGPRSSPQIIKHEEIDDAPIVPKTYYARKGTLVHLPCTIGFPEDDHTWIVEHEDTSLRSRSQVYKDTDNPRLFIKKIINVQDSDAGVFTCSNGYINSSLQLIVYEGSEPLKASAEATHLDSIKVKWQVPAAFPDYVAGYIIRANKITGVDDEKSFNMDDVKDEGVEEFLLTQMSPGATYDITVVALYKEGWNGTFEGPASETVTIDLTSLDAPPEGVTVKSWKNSTMLVAWLPPRNVDPRYIDGYYVYYQAQRNRKPSGEVIVTSPGPDGQWRTYLKGVMAGTRYTIQVAAFADVSTRIIGPRSRAKTITHRVIKGAPIVPKKFYAKRETNIRLPCVASFPEDKLSWIAEHEDESMRSRSSTYVDKVNPRLLIKEIKNVQDSDAGLFTCSDGFEFSQMDLIVYEGSQPQNPSAEINSINSINVKWEAPDEFPEYVRGYVIRTREVTGSGGEKSFTLDNVKSNGKEEFVLTDLTPGVTYDIQVEALYFEGSSDLIGTFAGPASETVTLELLALNSPPENVIAKSWKNSTIAVKWLPPLNVDPSYIDGYIVYYETQSRDKRPSGEVTVTSPGPDGEWNTFLTGLRTGRRYSIEVAAFTNDPTRTVGPRSQPKIVNHEVVRGAPIVPSKYFARKDTTILLNCMASFPEDKLSWIVEHEDESMRSRSSTFVDTTNQKLFIKEITKVQDSDAGLFTCFDGFEGDSLELVVYEGSQPQNPSAEINSINSINVKWEAPNEFPEYVRGYVVRAREVTGSASEKTFTLDNVKPDGKEEVILTDLTPGVTYDMEVVPLYSEGSSDAIGTYEGRASETITVNLPNLDSPPADVNAISWKNSTIAVTWFPPSNIDPSYIDGYIVYYETQSRDRKPSGEVLVTSTGPDGRWSTFLTGLRTGRRYSIEVAAFTNDPTRTVGPRSQPKIVNHEVVSGPPIVPSKYFARKDTTIHLQCTASFPEDKLSWIVEHEDESMRSRSSTFVDTTNQKLLFKEIAKVQDSDAGLFTCFDGFESSSLELVVYEGSQPQNPSAEVRSLDSINVKWQVPDVFPEYVRGYDLHIRDLTGSGSDKSFKVDNVRNDGKEEFLLSDLTPGVKYEIKVVPLYSEGSSDWIGTFEGPESHTVTIELPNLSSPPEDVSAKSWKNSTIAVTWFPPSNVDPSYIDGYIVYYETQSRDKNPKGEVTVTSPGPDGQWSTFLPGLRTGKVYFIQVAAFTNDPTRIVGPRSQPETIKHEVVSGPPKVPSNYIARKGTTIHLHCVASFPEDKLKWISEHEDESLISRSSTYLEAKLLVREIKNVQESDAGFFTCTDGYEDSDLELVVYEVSQPQNPSAEVNSINSIDVKWEAPDEFSEYIKGYVIRTREVTGSGGEKSFTLDNVKSTGKEEFVLTDLTPGVTYDIEIVALYTEGPSDESRTFQGPPSPKMTITTPSSDSAPIVPETYYARKGTTIKLPCVTSMQIDKLRWVVEHEDRSLRSRSKTYADKYDPNVLVKEIRNVQRSDAGVFTCSNGKQTSPLQLIVYEGSHPLETSAQFSPPDSINVNWKVPAEFPEYVRGYLIHSKEIVISGSEKSFKVEDVRDHGKEEFLLTDVSPGTTYEIEVVALYAEGPSDESRTFEGPPSPKMTVTTSTFDSAPITPETFYARRGTTIELPCVSSIGGDKLRWVVEHEDRSMRSRSHTYVDQDDPKLLIREIRNVQESDTGLFTCGDGKQTTALQLVVYEGSHPLETSAQFSPPDSINVNWKVPAEFPEYVRGYLIHSKEMISGSEKSFKVEDVRDDGNEEFLLTDVSPGATYEIMVTALYLLGASDLNDTFEGPVSPKIIIEVPGIDAPPDRVRAEPWKNSTVLVTWLPPRNMNPDVIDGYIVYYEAETKNKKPSGNVVLISPEPDGQWNAILEGLKTRVKYNIQVATFTNSSNRNFGPKSAPVSYRHEGFVPELSISAVALGPEIVLVTVTTLGGSKVTKLRVLYSDDSAIKWDRVDFDIKKNYGIVTGLQPKSQYFFIAKAAVDSKARETVTHLTTPPSDLASPTNVKLTPKSDNSVLVSWDYDSQEPALGFMIVVETPSEDGQYSPYIQKAVFGENQALVEGLSEDVNYQVKVVPFNEDGQRSTCDDAVLFHFSSADSKTTASTPEMIAPYFLNEEAKEIEVNVGDPVKLTCFASGKPAPIVQWFKEGQPIGQPVEGVNEITLTGLQESTLLTCKAQNQVGEAIQSTRVTVTEFYEPTPKPMPPEFVGESPAPLQINPGEDVTLTCHVEGNPPPRVEWYRNGQFFGRPSGSRNEITVPKVEENTIFVCRAYNSYGNISRETSVEVIRRPEPTPKWMPPEFVGESPAPLQINPGEDVTLTCHVEGNPPPRVEWFRNGQFFGRPSGSRNEITVSKVEENTIFLCRAYNSYGTIFRETSVEVIRRPEPPKFVKPLPETLDVNSGDNIRLSCGAEGNPLPDITWYKDGVPASQNNLIPASLPGGVEYVEREITRPFNLKCVARNIYGIREAEIKILLKGPLGPEVNQDYDVAVRYVPSSPSQGLIKWNVNRGDIHKLRNFDLTFTDGDGPPLNRRMSPDRRSFPVNALIPQTRYTATIHTIPFSGEIVNSTISFIAAAPEKVTDKPTLYVDINEIRPTTASVEISTVNVDSWRIHNYRLQVKDLDVVSSGHIIFDQMYPRITSPINMQNLKPMRRFQLIVNLLSENLAPLLTTSAFFLTPDFGGYGQSVSSSSEEGFEPSSHLSTPAPIPEPDIRPVTRRPPQELTTDRLMADEDYQVVLRAVPISPSELKVKWVVERGDTDKIVQFDVILANMAGDVLIEKKVSFDDRTITFSSLTPNTWYKINVKTTPYSGRVVNSTINAMPKQPDRITNDPTLYLDVVEIRPTSARLNYYTVNLTPGRLAYYRLLVKEIDTGIAFLEKTLPQSGPSQRILSLRPLTRYQVTLNALARYSFPLLALTVDFVTPNFGDYQPAVSSYSSSPTTKPVTEELNFPPQNNGGIRQVDTTTASPGITDGQLRDSGYNVLVRGIPTSPTELQVKWIIDKGDIDRIKNYDVTIFSENGNVLLREKLPADSRSLLLRTSAPQSRLFIHFKTILDSGEVINSTASVAAIYPQKLTDKPTVYLDVLEIRPTNARIDTSVDNLDPSKYSYYRLRLKDLETGYTDYDANSKYSTPFTVVTRLTPGRLYQVTVDVMTGYGDVVLTTSANFRTPEVGGYFQPVSSSSSSSTEEPPTWQRNTETTAPYRTAPWRTPRPFVTTATTRYRISTATVTQSPIAEEENFRVILEAIPISPSQIKVKWVVDRGDIDKIEYFDMTVATIEGRVLVQERAFSGDRSIVVSSLTPYARHIINVMTVPFSGRVVNSTINAITKHPHKITDDPTLYLNVVEIRPTSARLDYSTVNLTPEPLAYYSFFVKEIDTGYVVLQGTLSKSGSTRTVQHLEPLRRYQATINAHDRYAVPLLTSSAVFVTPDIGQYQPSVSSSSSSPTHAPPEPITEEIIFPSDTPTTEVSRTTARPDTTTTQKPDTTTTQKPETTTTQKPDTTTTQKPDTTTTQKPDTTTTQKPDTTTTQKPDTTTTQKPDTTTTQMKTTTEYLEEEVDDDYLLTVKAQEVTPNRLHFTWVVDRGPINKIKGFRVTVNSTARRTLVQENMSNEQRDLMLHPTTPGRTYIFNVQAIGDDGVLAESKLSVTTPPADSVPDNSNPVLNIDVNEIRPTTANLMWLVTNADKDLVRSHRIQIFQDGPEGRHFATHTAGPTSTLLQMTSMTPNEHYYAIVEALDKDDKVILTSALTFETPSPGEYGVPVHATSGDVATETPGPEALPTSSTELPEPVLNVDIHTLGNTTVQLRWHLENPQSTSVSSYKIVIRRDGPGGSVLLEEPVHGSLTSYNIDGVYNDGFFYIELKGLSSSGQDLLAAGTPYIHGVSVTPVKASSRINYEPKHIKSVDPQPTKAPELPDLELELNPSGVDQVKINWTLSGENGPRQVYSYKIKVVEEDPVGRTLLDKEVTLNTKYHTVYDLRKNVRYNVRLEALDSFGKVVVYAASPYLVPPLGYSVEPIRSSSLFNTKQEAKTETKTKKPSGKDDSNLVLVQARAAGKEAIYLEWYNLASPTGKASKNTMVRYAEFKDNRRDNSKILRVSAPQNSLTIQKLKPGSTYGVQIASMASSDQYVRWSKLSLIKTENS